MKWIGQHIWDFYSRFRNDVYLESLTTTTDTSVLVVDSNDKVCKNTTTLGGDITEVVAGVGLSGGGAGPGAVTLTLDLGEYDSVPPTDGDYLAVLDSDGETEQLTSLNAFATLLAGNGLDAGSSVLSVDVSDFMTNGVDNRVLTATGTDAMNAEANLTFDGSRLLPTPSAHDTVGTAIAIGGGATTAGTTNNIAGGDFTIHGGVGKGTGAGGDIYFQTSVPSGSSDATLNSLVTAFKINDDGSAAFTGAVNLGTAITFDNIVIDRWQASGEAFSDDDTSLMTSAAIDDRINAAVTAEDLDVTTDSGTIDIDLNSETLTIGGTANEVETSATGTTVTVGLPSDVTVAGDLTVTGGDIVLGAADGTASTIKRLSNASGSAGADFSVYGANAVGTNIAGGPVKNHGGLGTGTGAPGSHQWLGGKKTGSGSSAQSYAGLMQMGADLVTTSVNTLRLYSTLNVDDWLAFDVAAEGATTISTIDADTAAAHLDFNIDGHFSVASTGIDIATNGTITNAVWNGTAIASAYMASGTDSAKGALELATTGEADTGTDTARAITAAGLESHVSARYHYQYVNFIGNSDIATNWGIPTDNGANAHAWSSDTGVSGTTVGSTTYSAARGKSTIGFTVPYTGVLVGFYGTARNQNNSNNMALGLFVGPPDWGSTGSTDYTLRAYGTGSYSGGSGTNYKGALKVIDLARSHTLTAGDIIIPAVLETTADKVFCNMTVVIKTLIPT